MSMDVNEVIRQYVEEKKSINQLAREFSTYPARIFRLLKKQNVDIRDKSDAQKNALESGVSKHPTKGKKMSNESRLKISEKNAKKWAQKTEDERKEFSQRAKDNWEKKTPDEKAEMARKAGAGLRKASVDGSKQENFLYEKLMKDGFVVQMHRNNIGGQYEVDLYLPEYSIAIEVDGPQHFLPVFGEEKLQKNIKFDTIKNGILVSKGITVIRVKYLKKHTSLKILNDLWEKVRKSVWDRIYSSEQTGQLIEIEV